MDTFMVMFELPSVGNGEMTLDGAFAVASEIVTRGMVNAYPGSPVPLITVSVHVERKPQATMRWSATVPGDDRSSRGREFTLTFDAAERRGMAMISDDAAADPSSTTIYMRPDSLARLCRSVMAWPIDMIDELARYDEARRRIRDLTGGK